MTHVLLDVLIIIFNIVIIIIINTNSSSSTNWRKLSYIFLVRIAAFLNAILIDLYFFVERCVNSIFKLKIVTQN